MDKSTAQTTRAMAWERAKGELKSMRHTFWPAHGTSDKFKAFDERINAFIKSIEGDELHT